MEPTLLDARPATDRLIQTWNEVWGRMTRIVREVRDGITPHLGLPLLGAGRVDGGGLPGEIRVGRTRLRFEPEADPADPDRLDVRIVRLHPGAPAKPESTLTIDTVTRSWRSTVPELGPHPLRDEDALEKLVFGLLVDRPPPQRASSAGIIPTSTRCGDGGLSSRTAHRGQETIRSSSTAT